MNGLNAFSAAHLRHSYSMTSNSPLPTHVSPAEINDSDGAGGAGGGAEAAAPAAVGSASPTAAETATRRRW